MQKASLVFKSCFAHDTLWRDQVARIIASDILIQRACFMVLSEICQNQNVTMKIQEMICTMT